MKNTFFLIASICMLTPDLKSMEKENPSVDESTKKLSNVKEILVKHTDLMHNDGHIGQWLNNKKKDEITPEMTLFQVAYNKWQNNLPDAMEQSTYDQQLIEQLVQAIKVGFNTKPVSSLKHMWLDQFIDAQYDDKTRNKEIIHIHQTLLKREIQNLINKDSNISNFIANYKPLIDHVTKNTLEKLGDARKKFYQVTNDPVVQAAQEELTEFLKEQKQRFKNYYKAKFKRDWFSETFKVSLGGALVGLAWLIKANFHVIQRMTVVAALLRR